jgi:hypothetical protein
MNITIKAIVKALKPINVERRLELLASVSQEG